jgi:hypothetical protein
MHTLLTVRDEPDVGMVRVETILGNICESHALPGF